MKIHLAIDGQSACGNPNGSFWTKKLSEVTCEGCKNSRGFHIKKAKQDAKKV